MEAKGYKILPSPKYSHNDNMTFNKANFKFHMSPIKNALAHNYLIWGRVMFFLGGGRGGDKFRGIAKEVLRGSLPLPWIQPPQKKHLRGLFCLRR